jgi:hypothetical protein
MRRPHTTSSIASNIRVYDHCLRSEARRKEKPTNPRRGMYVSTHVLDPYRESVASRSMFPSLSGRIRTEAELGAGARHREII